MKTLLQTAGVLPQYAVQLDGAVQINISSGLALSISKKTVRSTRCKQAMEPGRDDGAMKATGAASWITFLDAGGRYAEPLGERLF